MLYVPPKFTEGIEELIVCLSYYMLYLKLVYICWF